ncbi:hypothetical protein PHET_12115, partial [Paragonimus heterotremus]
KLLVHDRHNFPKHCKSYGQKYLLVWLRVVYNSCLTDQCA